MKPTCGRRHRHRCAARLGPPASFSFCRIRDVPDRQGELSWCPGAGNNKGCCVFVTSDARMHAPIRYADVPLRPRSAGASLRNLDCAGPSPLLGPAPAVIEGASCRSAECRGDTVASLLSLPARRRTGVSQRAGNRIPAADIDDPARPAIAAHGAPPARARTGHRQANRSRNLMASTGMGSTSAHAPTRSARSWSVDRPGGRSREMSELRRGRVLGARPPGRKPRFVAQVVSHLRVS